MKKKPSIRVVRFLVLGAVSLIVLLVGYIFYLDYQIRSKFEARRWNLPSRVYSDAFYLYPDQKIDLSKVRRKLERLSYKKMNQSPQAVGEFFEREGSLKIWLHDFVYPAGELPGFPVEVIFSGDKILSMVRLDNGETLKTLKMEPELIASVFDAKMEDRTLVTLAEIPENLTDAVITIEDERFYSHYGVDPQAILRAFLTNLLHLRAVQGGSTLTQQLIKNYFLTSEKTLSRKLNEFVMALLLEIHYSKEEILEAYLNEIYFGQRGPVSVTGVEEASRFYFSKGVSQLSLAESALLAGVIRFPGEYSPFRNPQKAQDRRNFVLKMMEEKEVISKEDHQKAKKEKIVLPQAGPRAFRAPFFVDFVQGELRENYPGDILQSEGLRIFTTLDMEAQEAAETSVEGRLTALVKESPKLKKLAQADKKPEAILLSLQPQTGSIRAFVGGRDYEHSQFNRVQEAYRQPGSAFKPFVYATALNESVEGRASWHLNSWVEDTAFSTTSGGKKWSPENYDDKEHGRVTLRTALEQSYNIATTKLAMDVGLDKIVDFAREAGIESPLSAYPSLALGAFEVTPLELARAYTMFPNQGTRVEPRVITAVMTREGKVLEKNGLQMQKVISPQTAYLMNYVLQGVFNSGTAASARTLGFTGMAAGKTGTTSDYKDSWFVGYTPDLLTLTWVGFDDGTPTGLSGASGALPIWADFMKTVTGQYVSQVDFPLAENIVFDKVSRKGGLYHFFCGEPFEEAFVKGMEPTESCR